MQTRGWSGGAMVLGKLPVPGRPANLDYSRARAYCACSGCGWGGLDIFSLAYHFSFLSPSLWEMARYRLKYCLKEPLSPKQRTTTTVQTQIRCHIMWHLMRSALFANWILHQKTEKSYHPTYSSGYNGLKFFLINILYCPH